MRLPATKICALALLVTGCASTPNPAQIDSVVRQAVGRMDYHSAGGQPVEAAVIARSITFVDPAAPGVQKAIENEPVELFDRGLAGSNKRLRVDRDSGFLRRVIFYIPDRILDILDLISVDLHLGLGLYLDVHATRFFTIAAGARTVAGVGWHDARSLGLQTQADGALWGVFGFGGYSGTRLGTSGADSGSYLVGFLNLPGDDLYQDYADYWSAGVGVTAGVIGADVELHLYQALDLIAGIIFLDPARDDFATTQGLDMSSDDQHLIVELGKIASDEEAMEAYRRWKSEQTAAPAAPAPAPTEPATPEAAPDDAASTDDTPAAGTPAADPPSDDPPSDDPSA